MLILCVICQVEIKIVTHIISERERPDQSPFLNLPVEFSPCAIHSKQLLCLVSVVILGGQHVLNQKKLILMFDIVGDFVVGIT